MFHEVVTGVRGARTPFDTKYKAAKEQYLKYATSAISEAIALELIAYFMKAEFLRKLGNVSSSTAREFFEAQNNAFLTTFFEDGVYDQIVKGLRYHIFTPRSFATLIEAVFAFEGLPGNKADDKA